MVQGERVDEAEADEAVHGGKYREFFSAFGNICRSDGRRVKSLCSIGLERKGKVVRKKFHTIRVVMEEGDVL